MSFCFSKRERHGGSCRHRGSGSEPDHTNRTSFWRAFCLVLCSLVANSVDKESVTWTTSLDFSKAFLSILVSVFGDSREKVLRLLKCNLVTVF